MNAFLLASKILHVIAGSLWLGEIVFINAVVIPLIARITHVDSNGLSLGHVMLPKIFRLASVLSATTSITGLILLQHALRTHLPVTRTSLVAMILLFTLTVFHFFASHIMQKKLVRNTEYDRRVVCMFIKIAPRFGLVLASSIFILLMRGFVTYAHIT